MVYWKYLKKEARADATFWQLLRMYLDPFAFFKDASRGRDPERRQALHHNRALRWIIPVYIRRWALIGVALLLGIEPAQAYAAMVTVLPLAIFSMGLAVSLAIIAAALQAYLLLGRQE